MITYGKPKTRSGEDRMVPLVGWVPATLERLREQQRTERESWGEAWTDSGLVFTAPDGTGLIPQSVSEAFARLVTAYGMPALTFHGLRHTCASVLLAAGLPMPVASRMLGHSSIGITVDTYGHVVMDVTTRDAVTVRWQGSRLVGVRSLARTLASGVCRRSWKGARDHHRR